MNEYKYFEFENVSKKLDTTKAANRHLFIQTHLDKLNANGWEIIKINEQQFGLFGEVFKIGLWAKKQTKWNK